MKIKIELELETDYDLTKTINALKVLEDIEK